MLDIFKQLVEKSFTGRRLQPFKFCGLEFLGIIQMVIIVLFTSFLKNLLCKQSVQIPIILFSYQVYGNNWAINVPCQLFYKIAQNINHCVWSCVHSKCQALLQISSTMKVTLKIYTQSIWFKYTAISMYFHSLKAGSCMYLKILKSQPVATHPNNFLQKT